MVDRGRGDRADPHARAHGLELVDSRAPPCPSWPRSARGISTPIAADESITGPDDVRAAAAAHACDAVNVKLASCGGISAPARRSGPRANPGSPPTCRARSTAHGESRPRSSSPPVRLPARVWARDARAIRLAARPAAQAGPRGLMPVPQGPGLGVEIDEDVLATSRAPAFSSGLASVGGTRTRASCSNA